ncbi:leucine-rich repeat protein [uncultured Dialister sp.]|uniref:leucine-rich repeat protein n=1 Tax=uncultured Dialister sp. TaxID=278064 RepID=UPI00262A43FF|nr:leucine-rich repeat protein [uncultured Dialister sp.]
MFCMNCGKPLPDGSRFCPHCGTPVPAAKDSPEGPSLDDLIRKVKEKQGTEGKIHPIFCSPDDDSDTLRPYHDGERGVYAFDMDGFHFEYDERQVGFYRLLKAMMDEAKNREELKRIYLGEGDVKGLLQFVSDEKAVQKLFESVLKKESSLLMSRGIYGLEFRNFMTRDTTEGAPSALDAWQDFIESLLKKVGDITGSAEAVRRYRELRKEYRGRIIGGGFGIGGAIEGMITAGIANLVIGAGHSLFNAMGNALTNSRERRELEELYASDELMNAFMEAYRKAAFFLVMDASDRLHLLPPDKEDMGVPPRILSAIQEGELEKGRWKEGAAYALAHNPCHMLSYKLFYAFGRDRDGTADRIAEAFGLAKKLEETKYELSLEVLEAYGRENGLPMAALLKRMKEGGSALDEIMDQELLPKAGEIAAAMEGVEIRFPYGLMDRLKKETEEIVIRKGKARDTGDGSTIPSFYFYHRNDESITLPEGVTALSDYAFCYCPNLKEIKLPNSLRTIGRHAFYRLPSLKTLSIPASVPVYPLSAAEGETVVKLSPETTVENDEDRESSVRLDIPLGGRAYESMKAGNLPDSYTTILTKEKAEDIIAGKKHTSLPVEFRHLLPDISRVCNEDDDRFPEVIHIPEDTVPITKLDSGAFYNAPICYLHLKGDVKEIGESCFQKSTICQIKADEGLEAIGAHAFEGLLYFAHADLPSTLSFVGDYAFAHCRELHFMELLQMDCHIGKGVFEGDDMIICCLPGSSWETYCRENHIPYYLKGEKSPLVRKAEVRQIVRKSRARDHWHIYDNSKYYSHDGFMDDFKRTAPSTSSIRGIPVDSRGREKEDNGERIYFIRVQAEKNGDYDREAMARAIMADPRRPTYTSADGKRHILIYPWTMTFNNYICTDTYNHATLLYVNGGTDIEYIGEYAFASSELIAFYGEKVKEVWVGAFKGAKALTYVELGNQLQSLEDEAFAHCSNLKTITLPSSLRRIGKDVFRDTPVTVKCEKDSRAYAYCMENGIPVEMSGLVDW